MELDPKPCCRATLRSHGLGGGSSCNRRVVLKMHEWHPNLVRPSQPHLKYGPWSQEGGWVVGAPQGISIPPSASGTILAPQLSACHSFLLLGFRMDAGLGSGNVTAQLPRMLSGSCLCRVLISMEIIQE